MSLILRNGKIRVKKDEFASAVLIEGGIISAVGSDDEITAMAEEGTEVIDLQGRLAMPGFNDSHMHFIETGLSFTQVDLTGTGTIAEAVDLCGKAAQARGKSESGSGRSSAQWIEAFGWNDDNWTEKRKLTRYDLDQATTEYPVFAKRVCNHVCTVNSKGLEVLGIKKGTPQPAGGSFGVDETGEPDGLLYEMLPQVYDTLPVPDVDDIKSIIVEAGNAAAAAGITSVQTDDFEALPGRQVKAITEAYHQLAEEGRLPVRVCEQCCFMSVKEYEEFKNMGFHTGWGDRMFHLGPLKTFCDGSLGARTAWLKEDYSDDPGNRGMAKYDDENELFALIEGAQRDGMSVAIHAIGDAAAEQAVTAIERAEAKYPDPNTRNGIVHAQILSEDLIQRMARLHLTAFIQPVFLEYDLHMAESRVGAERLENSYNFRKMYDSGICTAMGTDSPVEPFAPLKNIYCAVTGRDFDGQPEEGWHREKLLTVDEAADCYTQASARASLEEDFKGSIKPGYVADITVLDRDIFSIPKDEIQNVGIALTVMDGRITYRRDM